MTRGTRAALAAAAGLAVAAGLFATAGPGAALPLRDAAAVPPSFTVSGSGFGHGVGMTQYGALGQARAGRSAADIVRYYYTGASVAAVNDAVNLRVSIAHAVSSVVLAGEAVEAGGGGVLVQPTAGGATALPATAGVAVTLTVGSSPAGPVVTASLPGAPAPAPAPSAGPEPSASPTSVSAPKLAVTWQGTRDLAGPASVLNLASPAAGESLADSKRHRYRWGTVEVSVVGGRLEVVNVVRIHDEYLRGLGEMPSSWPADALQAQVIASRSYALNAYNAGVKGSCACHLDDGTSSQVFLGWSKENEPTYGARWVAAVSATQPDAGTGLALTSGGRVVPGYFSSSSGGRTENNEDVWGGSPLSYLRSLPDPWSADPAVNPSFARWTRTPTQAAVASAFGLPDVASVVVGGRTAGGTPLQVTATSSSGTTAVVSGFTLRSRLGLPSAWVAAVEPPAGWVATPAPGTVPLPPVNAVYTTPSAAHLVNGRQWRTRCEPYAGARSIRCFTDIVATTVTKTGSRYVTGNGWVFNNLTYRDLDGPAWTGNVLATPGEHLSGGRRWRTTCTTATAWRTCRSDIWATVISRRASARGYTYVTYGTWQFNNMVWLYRGA